MRITQLCDMNLPPWVLKELQELQSQKCRKGSNVIFGTDYGALPFPLKVDESNGGQWPKYRLSTEDGNLHLEIGLLGNGNEKKNIEVNYKDDTFLVVKYTKPDYDWSKRLLHTASFELTLIFDVQKYSLDSLKASLVDSILTITATKAETKVHNIPVTVE